ncbi:ATP-dependent DNA ligase [Pseudokineococcus lusitanus]|uniref:DNA ligase (ATP) n=2 Tax=Pseudokineococcus lusitanus TaxID=763993 RepID=A0A3N1G8X5_9ACTN|nr:ATP-dependent DNA ligase [Pseudokineococcus lusitanus]ROP26695.1 ATP-dependent DNA ligase [Pseudokineococcus lusitanus]
MAPPPPRPPARADAGTGDAPADLRLPVLPPVEPMLARAAAAVPDPAATEGGLWFEPKWDGFRCVVFYDGDRDDPVVELGSRGGKSLTRYFPEVVAELVAQLGTARCVVDGELVVRAGRPGAERLDWDTLSQRIHPAASRVRLLAEQTPASFVAFDLLADGDDDLTGRPAEERRALLEERWGDVRAPLHLTRRTDDADVARRWLEVFEGAGLDGVVAKPRTAVYEQGRRVMTKVKHARTADVVVVGYRVHKSGAGVGSLLLGLRAGDGAEAGVPGEAGAGGFHQVGGASAFTAARRLELVEELAPHVERDDAGEPLRGAGERNRFSRDRDGSFVVVRPELVCEVAYDQLEKGRFRHVARFLRWRPDRDPLSCTWDQLDVPADHDLADVLART